MYLVDYHLHPLAHGEYEVNRDYLIKFIRQAERSRIKEIGFTDHDRFIDEIDWNLFQEIKTETKIKIRLGLEISYSHYQETDLREKIVKLPLDYKIGSVHRLGNWLFDHPDYKDEFEKRDIDEVYYKYFEMIKKVASSGDFDIIGHFDLIKIFGHRPVKKNILVYVDSVLQTVKDRGLALEINTNGLNKPVQEIYPSLSILKRAYEMGIPLTTGSDAHLPDRTGENIKEVVDLMKNIGYREIATFDQGRMKEVAIG